MHGYSCFQDRAPLIRRPPNVSDVLNELGGLTMGSALTAGLDNNEQMAKMQAKLYLASIQPQTKNFLRGLHVLPGTFQEGGGASGVRSPG